ncbi:hypothetical protein ANACOL_03028 [Anaerotruncus colihominis DSM 17241]|uniref:Uncharacterized protein n=1 Tax=Anaerotruncus colihominis DSM 17241 TaxID=445972 RepID=B0PD74_9FIRM|nr:hypothetical protein ANACOL_03028 [Anaerotruncus colihominis DSM 17241]
MYTGLPSGSLSGFFLKLSLSSISAPYHRNPGGTDFLQKGGRQTCRPPLGMFEL